MEISTNIEAYFTRVIDMAYEQYCVEMRNHTWLAIQPRSFFADYLCRMRKGMHGIVGVEHGDCVGFLLYSLRERDSSLYCDIPVWGYGATGKAPARTIGMLFQCLAERVVLDRTVCFSVRLYASDEDIQKLFSWMTFGIQSEKGIRRIEPFTYSKQYTIRKICKDELLQRWSEIWGLLTNLIDHLKKSPVFYPGYEFTENLYKDFFLDIATKVYIAENNDKKIIGLIERNAATIEYLFPDVNVANVGEIYVEPTYRGQMVAQALLHYLDTDLYASNIQYEWVEHGTANPTARGFWNKYFETFEYEFVRSIYNESRNS